MILRITKRVFMKMKIRKLICQIKAQTKEIQELYFNQEKNIEKARVLIEEAKEKENEEERLR